MLKFPNNLDKRFSKRFGAEVAVRSIALLYMIMVKNRNRNRIIILICILNIIDIHHTLSFNINYVFKHVIFLFLQHNIIPILIKVQMYTYLLSYTYFNI